MRERCHLDWWGFWGHVGEGRVIWSDRSWGLRVQGMQGLLYRID